VLALSFLISNETRGQHKHGYPFCCVRAAVLHGDGYHATTAHAFTRRTHPTAHLLVPAAARLRGVCVEKHGRVGADALRIAHTLKTLHERRAAVCRAARISREGCVSVCICGRVTVATGLWMSSVQPFAGMGLLPVRSGRFFPPRLSLPFRLCWVLTRSAAYCRSLLSHPSTVVHRWDADRRLGCIAAGCLTAQSYASPPRLPPSTPHYPCLPRTPATTPVRRAPSLL